jgi:hypothetical protein
MESDSNDIDATEDVIELVAHITYAAVPVLVELIHCYFNTGCHFGDTSHQLHLMVADFVEWPVNHTPHGQHIKPF